MDTTTPEPLRRRHLGVTGGDLAKLSGLPFAVARRKLRVVGR